MLIACYQCLVGHVHDGVRAADWLHVLDGCHKSRLVRALVTQELDPEEIPGGRHRCGDVAAAVSPNQRRVGPVSITELK